MEIYIVVLSTHHQLSKPMNYGHTFDIIPTALRI